MIVRWSTPLGLADLSVRGYVPPTGPILRAPDGVIVVVARSDDGTSLDLAVEPQDDPVQTTLHFEALQPGRRYRVGDAELLADGAGGGSVTITVGGLVRLRLEPV